MVVSQEKEVPLGAASHIAVNGRLMNAPVGFQNLIALPVVSEIHGELT